MPENDLASLLCSRQVGANAKWHSLPSYAPSTRGEAVVRIGRNGSHQIKLSGEGGFSPEQAFEIGDYLIRLAESLHDFSDLPPFKKKRVSGRSWGSSHGVLPLGAGSYRGRMHSNGMLMLRRDNGWVVMWLNGIVTPRLAREVGAYLCSLAKQ